MKARQGLHDLSSLSVDADLALTPIRLRDTHEIYTLVERNRDRLRRWLPWVDDAATPHDTERFVRASLAMQKESGGIQFGIWFRHVLTGVIGYHRLNWDNRKTDIGYWLGAAWEGRGLVTRACRRLIDVAYNELDLHRIQILCAPGNARSRAIPERLGFVQEGVLRQAEWLYDHFEDSVVYGLLAPDWRHHRGRR